MQGGLDNFARLTEGDPLIHAMVVDKLKGALDGYQHFYRRDVQGQNRVLAVETIIGARNIFNHVRPSYPYTPYAAVTLRDPVALRETQLYLEDGRGYTEDANGPFFYYHLLTLQSLSKNQPEIEAILAANTAKHKPMPYLPMEQEAPDFVWTDIDAQVVVIKHGLNKMYVMFNWRRPRWEATDITRIHLIRPMTRRVANVMGSHLGQVLLIPASAHDPRGLAPDGKYYDYHSFEILNEVRFGKCIVVQNVSKTQSFQFAPHGVRKAIDLSDHKIRTQFPMVVRPRTAVVLEVLD
jgi:hypothetical protein